MTNLEDKIKKLPKWAQQKIARLRSELPQIEDVTSVEFDVDGYHVEVSLDEVQITTPDK